PVPTYKDEARLQDGDVAPANVNSDEAAIANDKVQPEDRNQPPTNQSSGPKDVKQNLSYLAYYAYSEVPPDTKPAGENLSAAEVTDAAGGNLLTFKICELNRAA